MNIDSGYSKFYKYPSTTKGLSNMIDEAYNSRFNNQESIVNPRDRFSYNKTCD